MECSHSLLTDFLTSLDGANQLRRWFQALLFTGAVLTVPAVWGQGGVRPTYVPAVSDAYFYGNSNEVYPNPYAQPPEHFKPAPGESHPVANREVRARARTERRENFRKKFLTTDSPRRETEPRTIGSFQPELLERDPLGSVYRTSPQVFYPENMKPGFDSTSSVTDANTASPAPMLWNSDGTTSALPVQESSAEGAFQSSASDSRKITSESRPDSAVELILEDVPLPDSEILMPEVDPVNPEAERIRSKAPAASSSGKSKAPEGKAAAEDLLETVPENLKSGISAQTGRQLRPISEAASSEDSMDSADAADWLLEPVPAAEPTQKVRPSNDLNPVRKTISPEQTNSGKEADSPRAKRSILETSACHRDFQIQQAAFSFSSSNSETVSGPRYPVRKSSDSGSDRELKQTPPGTSASSQTPTYGTSPRKTESSPNRSRESFRFPWQSRSAVSDDVTEAGSAGSMNSPMVSSRMPYAVSESRLSGSADAGNRQLSPDSSVAPVASASVPVSGNGAICEGKTAPKTLGNARSIVVPASSVLPASQNSQDLPVSKSLVVPENSEPSNFPLAETLTYTPQFSEWNAPIRKLKLRIPERQVFQDFGLRKTLEKSALPWYAAYIQDLDVNEEHLFNSLRLLGNSKLSQSRCQFTLMEAGIIASHPKDAAEANRLVNLYDNIEYYLLQETSPIDAHTELSVKQREELKAETILAFMHEYVLINYQLEGTTISNLLEHGLYNCVTATILYCSLAEKAGLNVTAVELPGHAMCWVYLNDGERLEVETTCENWFKYRNDPETQKKVICKLIRDASPQLKDQSDKMLLLQVPQPISDKRLIAKIYYNQGVDLLSVNDFAGALEANSIAYCLDPQSKTTFGNLLATMNNWAIALCKEGKYEKAAELLRTGLRFKPDYPPFKNNHTHVYHRWVESLYRKGELNEALRIASIAAQEQPDVAHFKRLQTQIEQSIAIANQETVIR